MILISLSDLSLFLYFSLCVILINLFVRTKYLIRQNKYLTCVRPNKYLIRTMKYVLHPNKPISSKKIILCPKISTDPEPCYYTS